MNQRSFDLSTVQQYGKYLFHRQIVRENIFISAVYMLIVKILF
jgi:hypothetical protein